MTNCEYEKRQKPNGEKNTYETDVTSRDQKRSASNTDETEFPSEDKTNDETGNEGGNTLNNTAMETIS